ncbi:DNA-3-methyladenine glycosylase II [Pseudomonas savastanoi]|uniref:DNA-3-methyladenine glycosylase II n=2 Tax=Pseudomonas syringae group TaxID=136849 RepID=A0A0N8R444_PSESX|nr:DNA-3-methyladenine glycosylase II [Pseudomonas syringae pv. castaneae]RMS89603.1 DNA-3-methyladenine glycosylase II [Pseudomonas savastanoi]
MSSESDSADRRHAEAVAALRSIDPQWQSLIDQVGPCLHPVSAAQDPFQALVKAVAYQQLHARAGDAMVMRLRALFVDDSFPGAQALVELDDQALRSCGFSASKCRAIKAIAAARVDGLVPEVSAALAMGNEALVERLIQLPGVGRWTVEMMLIYGLGQLDVMPASDFGVCEGYRRLMLWNSNRRTGKWPGLPSASRLTEPLPPGICGEYRPTSATSIYLEFESKTRSACVLRQG